ncbi:Ribonuclease P protein component 2 [Candidatus Tiddalikarchaeum anstoanum]|nr:Ribonuclease P protein component 2 [Candidatus Tiddalikarchaeum anstoanum]
MILPSSRHKKRYIYFEVISDEKVFKDEVKKGIYDTALRFLGEDGFSKAGIQIVNDNIIRVDSQYKDTMIAVLSLVRRIGEKQIVINTLKTSGSIKKLAKNEVLKKDGKRFSQ